MQSLPLLSPAPLMGARNRLFADCGGGGDLRESHFCQSWCYPDMVRPPLTLKTWPVM